MIRKWSLGLVALLFVLVSHAQEKESIIHEDLLYAAIGDRLLSLDLYLPKVVKDPYVIVWVHGGAWHSGSKENPPLEYLPHGYGLASIEYRLSTEATFPAQIRDIKAAIQWLRGHAEEYGFRADKVVIWGSSAGGHLAALVGTTNGMKEFDPDFGHHSDQPSDVQGIIDFFGPTNFNTILSQSTPHGLNVRTPAMAMFFGKPAGQDSTERKLASPVFHVDESDPPIFIAHGNQDNQVPINQSIELKLAYEKAGLPVTFEIVGGAGHGGPGFHSKEMQEKVLIFLRSVFGN